MKTDCLSVLCHVGGQQGAEIDTVTLKGRSCRYNFRDEDIEEKN